MLIPQTFDGVACWSLALRSVLFIWRWWQPCAFITWWWCWVVNVVSAHSPEVHGVHGVFVAKSVFRFIGNFLVWLSSGSCSTPSMYSLSTTSFTCLFSLLASRIKGYNLRRFSSISWGNCSFTHILLPFNLKLVEMNYLLTIDKKYTLLSLSTWTWWKNPIPLKVGKNIIRDRASLHLKNHIEITSYYYHFKKSLFTYSNVNLS